MTQTEPTFYSPAGTSQDAVALLPPIFDRETLYDIIMSTIEPELMIDELPKLKARYDADTPEEKQVRAKRYEDAMKQYLEELKKYQADWNAQMRAFEKALFEDIQKASQQIDDGDLGSLESAIDNF